MTVEGSDNLGAIAPPGHDKKGDLLVALEVAGAQALDGDEVVQWVKLANKVMERPESLTAITKAIGDAAAPILSPRAKAAVLWASGGVLVYNFVVRDLLILLLKLENTPPPAITYDSVAKLFGALFGF
ncbi:MAG: hypothetical protein ACRDC7_00860 [Aeromonas veronii]